MPEWGTTVNEILHPRLAAGDGHLVAYPKHPQHLSKPTLERASLRQLTACSELLVNRQTDVVKPASNTKGLALSHGLPTPNAFGLVAHEFLSTLVVRGLATGIYSMSA